MAVVRSGKDKQTRHLRIYLDQHNLSGDSRTFSSADFSSDEVDVTGWGDDFMQAVPNIATVGLSGYQAIMNEVAGRSFPVLTGSDTEFALSLLFGGGGAPDVGDPAYMLPSAKIGEEVSLSGGVAMLQSDFRANPVTLQSDIKTPFGVTLVGPGTGNLASGPLSSVDSESEAATTNGWWAILHIITADGAADYSVHVQHSTDDSAFATLATFTLDGTAVDSEILSGSGTVNRYVRVNVTETTPGTVAAIVTFARNF